MAERYVDRRDQQPAAYRVEQRVDGRLDILAAHQEEVVVEREKLPGDAGREEIEKRAENEGRVRQDHADHDVEDQEGGSDVFPPAEIRKARPAALAGD